MEYCLPQVASRVLSPSDRPSLHFGLHSFQTFLGALLQPHLELADNILLASLDSRSEVGQA